MSFAGFSAQMANRARRKAFEQQVLCKAGDLLQAALRFTRDLSLAEDLVQRTMLRAWYEFCSSTNDAICKVWLFKIMLGLWNCDGGGAYSNATWNGRTPEKGRVEDLRPFKVTEVKSSVDNLRGDLRLVLLLFAVDEFSCAEIAEILTIPIDTVISNLALARDLVKTDLGAQPALRASQ